MRKKINIALLILWFITGIIDLIAGPTPLQFMCVWIVLLVEIIQDILED